MLYLGMAEARSFIKNMRFIYRLLAFAGVAVAVYVLLRRKAVSTVDAVAVFAGALRSIRARQNPRCGDGDAQKPGSRRAGRCHCSIGKGEA